MLCRDCRYLPLTKTSLYTIAQKNQKSMVLSIGKPLQSLQAFEKQRETKSGYYGNQRDTLLLSSLRSKGRELMPLLSYESNAKK